MTTFSRIDGLARRVDQALAGLERLTSVIARVDDLALNKKIEAASKQAEKLQQLVQEAKITLDQLNQEAERRIRGIEHDLKATNQRATKTAHDLEQDLLDSKNKFETVLAGFKDQVERMLKEARRTITTMIDERMKDALKEIADLRRDVENVSKVQATIKDVIEANVEVIEQWKPLLGGQPFKGKLKRP